MSVPGLERGIAILRLFDRGSPSLTPRQIAEALDIPRTTVHRLLGSLIELGLVRRDGDTRFTLDAGVLTLGHEYLAANDITVLGAGILERLRNETNWSTHLAVRQDRSIVYLSRYASRASLVRNVGVGTTLPAHATLMGRVLLSDLEPTALRTLYSDGPLEPRGPDTPTTIAALEQMLSADRQRGFVASTGYYEAGLPAVAAPVRNASLRIVAAINATAGGAATEDLDRVTAAVVAAAAALSRLLGAPAEMPRLAKYKEEALWR